MRSAWVIVLLSTACSGPPGMQDSGSPAGGGSQSGGGVGGSGGGGGGSAGGLATGGGGGGDADSGTADSGATDAGSDAGVIDAGAPLRRLDNPNLLTSGGNGFDSNLFGYSVDIEGDTAVVGAPEQSLGTSLGRAYVLTRDAGTWVVTQKLSSGRLDLREDFGAAVALHGARLAVLSPAEISDAGNTESSVHVFERSGGDWAETARVPTPTPLYSFSSFGHYSIALSDDTLVVGNPDAYTNSLYQGGAVYLYSRTGSAWSQPVVLSLGTEAAQSDRFGCAVAIDGTVLAVGVRGRQTAIGSTAVSGRGAVVIYEQGTLGAWTQRAVISNAQGSFFGERVRLSGNTALIASPSTTLSGNTNPGALYVYVKSNQWTLQATLRSTTVPDPRSTGSAFDIALDGDIAVAAYQLTTPSQQNGILVFARDTNGSWGELPMPVTRANAYSHGYAIATSGTDTLVADRLADVRGKGQQGTVTAYRRAPNGVVTELAPPIDSGDGLVSELFGLAVARTATRLAVTMSGTAPAVRVYQSVPNGQWALEDSVRGSTLGANAGGFGFSMAFTDDEVIVGDFAGATDAGPGGVFYSLSRNGTSWRGSAPVIRATSATGDRFGRSLARNGDTLVVGAPGIGGFTGGAVVFERETATGRWLERSTLTAPSSREAGAAVAISADTILVGAPTTVNDATFVNRGAVYVFSRLADGGQQQIDTWIDSADAGAMFGAAVAIDGTTAFVGAPAQSDPLLGGSGNGQPNFVSIYARNVAGVWSNVGTLRPQVSDTNALFGGSLYLSGSRALVGSLQERLMGVVYVVDRGAGGVWSTTSTLTPFDAPNGYVLWRYGASLAMWQSEIAIGAPYWTGVGPLASPGAGAVYFPP